MLLTMDFKKSTLSENNKILCRSLKTFMILISILIKRLFQL